MQVFNTDSPIGNTGKIRQSFRADPEPEACDSCPYPKEGNHIIRTRQIKSQASRLERNKENRLMSLLKFKEASVWTAFTRCALTVAVVNKNFHR